MCGGSWEVQYASSGKDNIPHRTAFDKILKINLTQNPGRLIRYDKRVLWDLTTSLSLCP